MLGAGLSPLTNAAPTLSGATIFDGTPPDGYGYVWSTNTYGYYLFLASSNPAGAIINDPQGHINYSLSNGDNQFFVFGDWDRGTPKDPLWGIVLGFDGENSLNVYPQQSGLSALTSEAVSPYTSQPLQDSWSNSRTFVTNGFTIELLDFNILISNITGQDRVQPFLTGANGRDDAIGSFTLRVTDNSVAAIPEPETYAMMLAGLGIIGFATRNKQKSIAA